MKKRNFKNLTFQKKSISNLSILGGIDGENPSGGSEHNPNSMDILKCSPESVIPNTDCGCA